MTQVVPVLPAQAAPKAPHIITLTGSNATLGIADLNGRGPTSGSTADGVDSSSTLASASIPFARKSTAR